MAQLDLTDQSNKMWSRCLADLRTVASGGWGDLHNIHEFSSLYRWKLACLTWYTQNVHRHGQAHC